MFPRRSIAAAHSERATSPCVYQLVSVASEPSWCISTALVSPPKASDGVPSAPAVLEVSCSPADPSSHAAALLCAAVNCGAVGEASSCPGGGSGGGGGRQAPQWHPHGLSGSLSRHSSHRECVPTAEYWQFRPQYPAQTQRRLSGRGGTSHPAHVQRHRATAPPGRHHEQRVRPSPKTEREQPLARMPSQEQRRGRSNSNMRPPVPNTGGGGGDSP